MSHHGSNPFSGDFAGVFQKAMQQLREQGDIGATHKYPAGKLTPEDEGELRFALVRHGQKIVLSFGKAVEWIGFGPDEAIALAQALVKEAGAAKGVPMEMRIGRTE